MTRLANEPRVPYATTLAYLTETYKDGKTLLDVGCGRGEMALDARKLGYQVTGIDRLPVPNEVQLSGVSVFYLDLTQRGLPLSDKSFDVVLMADVIEHLPYGPRSVLREIHRVLKDDGSFIVSTVNLASISRRLGCLLGRDFLTPLRYLYECNPDIYESHYREFTINELTWMMQHSNFRVKKIKTLWYKTPNTLLRILMKLAALNNPKLREAVWMVMGK